MYVRLAAAAAEAMRPIFTNYRSRPERAKQKLRGSFVSLSYDRFEHNLQNAIKTYSEQIRPYNGNSQPDRVSAVHTCARQRTKLVQEIDIAGANARIAIFGTKRFIEVAPCPPTPTTIIYIYIDLFVKKIDYFFLSTKKDKTRLYGARKTFSANTSPRR